MSHPALTTRLAAAVALASTAPLAGAAPLDAHPQPAVVVGALTGDPPDSPAAHIDPNTVDSPFAGVVSLNLGGRFLASAVAISPVHLLTAAHAIDTDNDGSADFTPDQITAYFHLGSNRSHAIRSQALALHPDFTGFNNPNVNDDLAVLTLAEGVPWPAPIHPLLERPLGLGDVVTFVGFGQSGGGDTGITLGPSFDNKRVGQNTIDLFFNDDEGNDAPEIFFFDFDGPTGNHAVGGPTLGNDVEATIAPGDSGGPSFVETDDGLRLAGINTFTNGNVGFFGSQAGGTHLDPFRQWIGQQTALVQGDVDLDGLVGLADLSVTGANFRATDASWTDGDFNRDGIVSIADLSALAVNFESAAAPGPTVAPEPASAALWLAAAAALRRNSRPRKTLAHIVENAQAKLTRD